MRCPHCTACDTGQNRAAEQSSDHKKCGTYKRKSDSRTIQRFYCYRCQKTYSHALKDPAYNHNKRRINIQVKRLLASNISMRRTALLLGVSRTTIARKLIYLGKLCAAENDLYIQQFQASIKNIQFDELQTIEHTKCKPLSVAVAVVPFTRKILDIQVSMMTATGHLARIARKKYKYRPDLRIEGLQALFTKIAPLLAQNACIYSDKHPFYGPIIKQQCPHARHIQTKGEKATVAGQGELKKGYKDPLFYINQTLAMLRANINRLIRRTWCTTKCIDRLRDHLAIYMSVHNSVLTKRKVAF